MPQPIGAPRRARPARSRARLARFGALGLSLAVTATTLTACSSGSASVETPDLTIGYVNTLGAAPFLLGIKQGLFNQGGLNVTDKEFATDADEEKALKDGQIQIALGDYTSFLDNQNAARVAPLLQVVGEAYDAGSDTFGLVAARSNTSLSAATGPTIAYKIANADLTVSVPAFDSPEYVSLAAWAMSEQSPLPAPQATVKTAAADADPAAAAKQIMNNISSGVSSAGVLQEPYLTQALETGKVVQLANLSSGTAADMPVAGYFALTKFTQSNPNTIAAFDAALAQAQALGDSRVSIEQALEAQSVDATLAATTQIGNFPSIVVPATIDNVLSLMNAAGLQIGTLSSGTLTGTANSGNSDSMTLG
jgi:NitT/TauT family transport system substrate-binding protein